jgi:hypothetical protein
MPEKFQCPSCQKEYRWKPELAGKRAKCKCGTAIEIPVEDEPQMLSEDLGVYDVAETAPTPPAMPLAAAPLAVAPVAPPPARTPAAVAPALPYGAARLPWQAQGQGQRRGGCQVCGADAPVKYVEFHQNIGALVMRYHKSCKGNLCKSCIHSKFWSMTGTTLAVGWLGTISVVLAPIFVVNNTIRYIGCLGMPSSHDRA